MRVRKGLVLAALFAAPAIGLAQQPQPPDVHEHVSITAAALTPTRETTGTSWLPAETPMYGLHRPWRGWDLRVNGSITVQAIFEQEARHRTGGVGSRQLVSTNWGMVMARRPLGRGRLGLRTMLSAEPATINGCGALSLLSTGERCDGDTIHDRQQPHDLVMELAADYDRPLAGDWRWQLYAGLAGEPALGPPSYAHRPSAIDNPLRPIAHHWLDSTSTSFGVATLGVFSRRWKFEASAFNGRDADERRIDLDLGAFDSVAGRISLMPTDRLVLQVSAGRVNEVTSPSDEGFTATKLTTSLSYHRLIGADNFWATTVAAGFNDGSELIAGTLYNITSNAALLESAVTLGHHTVFARGERVAMPAHHLHAHEYVEGVYPVGKVQLGYLWSVPLIKGLVPSIGGTAAISILPKEFAPRYGGTIAPTLSVTISVRAARHAM